MMTAHAAANHPERSEAMRLGFWAGLATTILTLVSFGLAITAIPSAGPYCVVDCAAYPYTEVLHKVPGDFLWMLPAILLMVAFIVLMVCVHQAAPRGREVWSQIALIFGMLSAGLLAADYYVQYAVVQPSLLRGEHEGLAILSQYNPHGIFIAVEDIGYLLMGTSLLFVARVFVGSTWNARILRRLFAAAGVLTVVGWVAYYAVYGTNLEYRFEVYAISVNWLALAIGGGFLSRWFARQERDAWAG